MGQKHKKRIALDPFETQPLLERCAKLLRKARKAHGFTQKEVSIRIGLAQGSLAQVEYADHWPTVPHLLHWSSVVGVPMGLLFPDDPHASLIRVMRLLAACPPKVHEAISAWITGWAHVSPESLAEILLAPDLSATLDGEGT